MNVIITTKEIKEFFKRTRHIQGNKLLPILDYVKLDCSNAGCFLTKTNLGIYCRHEIEAEFKQPVSLLLDERILQVMADSGSDTISIELIKEKKKPGSSIPTR